MQGNLIKIGFEEAEKMKIAISAGSEDLEGQVNPVFGRCPGFLVVETEGKEIKESTFVQNQAVNVPQGAGISAAQTVIGRGAKAVITGNVGPNAMMVLRQSGIKIYHAAGMKISEAVGKMAEGKLQELIQGAGTAGPGAGFGRGIGRRAGGAGAGRAGRGAGQGMRGGRGTGIGGGFQ